MLLNYVDLPRRWVSDEEPRLELDWVRAAGLLNARVTVTPDELRGIQAELERLLEPSSRANQTTSSPKPVGFAS